MPVGCIVSVLLVGCGSDCPSYTTAHSLPSKGCIYSLPTETSLSQVLIESELAAFGSDLVNRHLLSSSDNFFLTVMKDTKKTCRSSNRLCTKGGRIKTQVLMSDPWQGPEQLAFYLYSLLNRR